MHAAQCSTIASVTIKPVEARPTRFGWLNPFLVVLLGTVVVAFLLAAPIRIGPGDHEKNTSCGNALNMDLGPWQRVPDYVDKTYYLDMAYRSCTSKRIDRVAQAVGVLSATLLIAAALMLRRELRRSSLIELEHQHHPIQPDDL